MSASPPPPASPHVTVRDFAAKKAAGDPLVMVSAYDALFARLADEGGVDAILVGDSLGNVIAGFESTVPVTLDMMIHHGAAVRRGTQRAMVVVDLPFLTYHTSVQDALRNCGRVMQETLAHGVKLEGGTEEVAAAVRAVSRAGIPVMGHIGFTPQHVHAIGGHRVQGRDPDAVHRLLAEAERLEQAGAFAIVLELIPDPIARRITETLHIPTIGIGAGAGCSGQVLVLLDLLGLNDTFKPKFLRRYADLAEQVRGAVRTFSADVRAGRYPAPEHTF